MEPLVSILIPAYNAEEWISDTINSALDQTWPRKEIIVVDDGSQDQTLSIAQQFASKEVIVVTQSNEGAARARNRALQLSRGDFIQWLDADDLLAPDKIAKQLEGFAVSGNRRTLLCSSYGQFLYQPSRSEFVATSLWTDLSPVEWLRRKMEQNIYMQTGTWLVSRELSEAAGPWDTRLLGDDDGEYFCRVILASDGIRFIPEAKMFYRRTGPSSLSYIGQSNRKLDAQFLSMRLHIDYLRSLEDSPKTREACVGFLQNWLIQFYPERIDLVKESKKIATELGGDLVIPRMSWKYAWIQKLFGWKAAKAAQIYYNRSKFSFLRAWDKTLSEYRATSLWNLLA